MYNHLDRYLESITTISDEAKIKKFVKVAGGVIMKEGENGEKLVLLIQRAKDDHFPNHYEIPRGKCDGGTNNKDEKLNECLKREIKEETGLDVKPIKYIDNFSYIADKGTRKSTQYNFLCVMVNPNQKVKLSHEHQDYKWIQSVGEVELYVLPEIKKSIVKVLNTDDRIVDYPESELSDDYIKEIFNPCNGKNDG